MLIQDELGANLSSLIYGLTMEPSERLTMDRKLLRHSFVSPILYPSCIFLLVVGGTFLQTIYPSILKGTDEASSS